MPCVAEVVDRSLKADCTDFTHLVAQTEVVHSLVQRLWDSFSEISFLL